MTNTIEDEFKSQVLDILNEEIYSMRSEDDSYVDGRQEATDRIVSEIIMRLIRIG